MKKNQTKVVCPKCGAEFAIPEKTTVAVGVIIGSDSNLGTIYPEVAQSKQDKAKAKIEALEKAGVNVSNLFSIRGVNGENVVGRLENGEFAIVPENDPIFEAIKKNGVVPNRRLFRRWVMAQVFHMMTEREWGKKNPMGFTKALQRKGYRYSWKMVVEEFRVQAKLFREDKENFEERNRWFNRVVAVDMAESYIKELEKVIDRLPVKKCKGVPYIKLYGTNIFTSDLDSKVYKPLNTALSTIKRANNPTALLHAVQKFTFLVKKTYMAYEMPMSRGFKDAYKGAGAFFTLKNLILFHDCRFPNMNTEQSESYLRFLTFSSPEQLEGYKLFGIMKEFLTQNNIDIEAKMAEWRN